MDLLSIKSYYIEYSIFLSRVQILMRKNTCQINLVRHVMIAMAY